MSRRVGVGAAGAAAGVTTLAVGRAASRAGRVAGGLTTRLSTPLRHAARKFSSGGEGAGGAGGGSKSLWERYAGLLESHPILTKALTSMVISAMGDIACQLLIEDHPFEWVRFFQFSAMGGVLVGPGLHFWYGFIGRMVPGVSMKAVLTRLALDQLVWAPPFIAVFLGTLKTIQGMPLNETMSILPTMVWEACKVNWTMWPAANFVNFRFVPGQYQVLFANFVAVFWNAYLSMAGNRKKEDVIEDAA